MTGTITQLNPPLYLLTPLGPAVCHFIWSNGPDTIWWGCFQDKTGESWWWQNQHVRLQTNITDGRYATTEIKLPPDLEAALAPHKERYKE